MAIIQPILGSLRGSIGDNTFSHNRGGDYVRRRVSPTNPNSTHILDAGDTRIDDPPTKVAPTALQTLAVDVSAALVADVTFTLTPLDPAYRIAMFMSLPQPGKAEPNFKQCRIVGYSDLTQASPWAATIPFTVNVGNKVVFFAAIYEDATGLLSGFLRAVDTADY
ncbi:hypothetical protein ES703_66192 [subsurface metagenome]